MAMIREFFQNLLYQVPAIGISDIVDILVVSIIFYSLLRLIRSTSAARVARAILLLLAITLLTDVLNLYTLNWLLNKILEVGAIALIIVFQPELRRALERVGAQLHFHLLSSESGASTEQSAISATVQACEIMSRGRVAAAGCVMPLSDNPHLPSDLGTRHRAGVGTSEVSDAVVVIVSEENGTISVAIGGMLKRHLAPQTLQRLLSNELLADEAEKKTLLKRLAGCFSRKDGSK